VLRRSARKARPAAGFGEESEGDDDADARSAQRRGNWCAVLTRITLARTILASRSPALPRRYRHVVAERDWAGAAVARVAPGAASSAALRASGFAVPLAIRPQGSSSSGGGDGDACAAAVAATAEALGLRLPARPLSVDDVAAGVGATTLVPTLDVARQGDGPRGLTAAAFAAYWADPAARRRRLLNCVSLSLARTPLAEHVAPPACVAALDLVAAAWPKHSAEQSAQSDDAPPLVAHSPPPEVLLYALMSPAGSYTDWHCDFGGSSVWYHLASGRKVFLLAPPSARNLEAFEAWAASPAQARTFLGDALEGVQRCDVAAGDTLLIPAVRLDRHKRALSVLTWHAALRAGVAACGGDARGRRRPRRQLPALPLCVCAHALRVRCLIARLADARRSAPLARHRHSAAGVAGGGGDGGAPGRGARGALPGLRRADVVRRGALRKRPR
jgi:hypothetical protein